MDILTNFLPSNFSYKFSCVKCDIRTNNKKDYNNHIMTTKHAANHICLLSVPRKAPTRHICKNCAKEYKCRQSLHTHKKKCINPSTDSISDKESPSEPIVVNTIIPPPPEDVKALTNMVIELMKSNQDLQNKMFEMCKNSSTTINNNPATNNSHNKTFNLQFFLNEQCKDAMNISDFAKSFDIQLADLESVGELGYVEGISRLIVKQLNGLDLYKRPMHCSDAKRETLYVKDQDKWEKETDDNPKIRKTIKNVSSQNFGLITKWRDAYPECRSSLSEYNQQFINIVKQANGGAIEIEDNENKIIRRLTKEVVIKKNE